jgi:hypothetical protein
MTKPIQAKYPKLTFQGLVAAVINESNFLGNINEYIPCGLNKDPRIRKMVIDQLYIINKVIEDNFDLLEKVKNDKGIK